MTEAAFSRSDYKFLVKPVRCSSRWMYDIRAEEHSELKNEDLCFRYDAVSKIYDVALHSTVD